MYNLAAGYAAKLTKEQACVDKGCKPETIDQYWRYFKAAMSHQGLMFRKRAVFSGTVESPCHIEIDETRVRKT